MNNINVLQEMSASAFETLTQQSNKIIYFKEVDAQILTPIIIFENLKPVFKDDFMLLENLMPQETSRYSFLSFDRLASMTIDSSEKLNKTEILTTLRAFKNSHQYVSDPRVLEKLALLTGFLTHDAIQLFENIPNKFHAEKKQLPLCTFNLYRFNLCFDHENATLLISMLMNTEENVIETYQHAKMTVDQLIQTIFQAEKKQAFHATHSEKEITVIAEPTDEQYIAMVEKAKEAIFAGEVFQVVLSRTFKTTYHVSPHALYLSLRKISPSPFMFYFTVNDITVIGASPERLVRIHDQLVSITPIAGTRRRNNSSDDTAIEQSLLTDEKELAEHKMLVDLARNDLGRISKIGSINIKHFLKVKHYSHVSHITSEVTGELADHIDAFDVLKATFPAGTLSGAPKIRALQLIDELETSDRGLYGGIICRFDANDNFDSCIAIRMAILQDGVATVRTGAGIVFDSDPVKEKEETEQKAHAMLSAIQHAHANEGVQNHVTLDR